jgi:hypothetical protein
VSGPSPAPIPLAAAIGPWRRPLVLGLLLVLADQLVQLWVSTGPFDLSVPISRFQAAALLAGRVAAFGLVAVMALVAIQGLAGRGARRGLGVVSLALALVLVAGLVILWSDGLRVRSAVPGDQVAAFTAQYVRGLVTSTAGAVGFGILGVRLLRP